MKILVIEDEFSLLEAICRYLEDEGHLCEKASDYNSAAIKIARYEYDCILVDITLPGGNGLDLIHALKQNKNPAGIIIISAKDSLDDKLAGLTLGSDDYLPKPFHLPELNARIQAVTRRRNFEGNTIIDFNEISVDTQAKLVRVNGHEIALTHKEYDLLLYFLSNKNRVLSKSAIVEHLWADNIDQADSYNFLYTHIKNLRRKIFEKSGKDYIATVYGMGYNFKSA